MLPVSAICCYEGKLIGGLFGVWMDCTMPAAPLLLLVPQSIHPMLPALLKQRGRTTGEFRGQDVAGTVGIRSCPECPAQTEGL